MATRKKTQEPARQGYHHGNLRAALMEAAEDLVREVGPADLSLREVARRAGVSHAAPYAHFQDKVALLAALADKAFTDMDRAMEDAQRVAPRDPESQWLATGLGYVLFGVRHPQVFRLMWRRDVVDPRGECSEERMQAPYKRLLDALERVPGAPARGTPAFDRDALLSWTTVHGLVMLMLDGPVPAGDHPAELARPVLERLRDIFRERRAAR